MKKQKANKFSEKFRLLNTQEHTEDIKWTSSSSSDYENTSCYEIPDKNRSRKRKRKKTTSKNISNLDITIIDTTKNVKNDLCREKSPILPTKCVDIPSSPILLTSRFPPNKSSSPILKQRSFHVRSPILPMKVASPKNSLKVKKNLSFNQVEQTKQWSFHTKEGDLCSNSSSKSNKREFKDENNYLISKVISDITSTSTTDNTASNKSLKEKNNLINKVKNYFNSHFSSENSSQNISDTHSPEECKTEEVDILTCRTQTLTNAQPLKQNSTHSDCSTFLETNSKKVKYKKGGLAHRLNGLLKKQHANISLWHHERFLAVNSKFVIPKEEHIVFCVQRIDFKYGCYMVNVLDVNNERYIILINSFYVNSNMFPNSILRLYEPYKITKVGVLKIIVNVCKFELVELKSN